MSASALSFSIEPSRSSRSIFTRTSSETIGSSAMTSSRSDLSCLKICFSLAIVTLLSVSRRRSRLSISARFSESCTTTDFAFPLSLAPLERENRPRNCSWMASRRVWCIFASARISFCSANFSLMRSRSSLYCSWMVLRWSACARAVSLWPARWAPMRFNFASMACSRVRRSSLSSPEDSPSADIRSPNKATHLKEGAVLPLRYT